MPLISISTTALSTTLLTAALQLQPAPVFNSSFESLQACEHEQVQTKAAAWAPTIRSAAEDVARARVALEKARKQWWLNLFSPDDATGSPQRLVPLELALDDKEQKLEADQAAAYLRPEDAAWDCFQLRR